MCTKPPSYKVYIHFIYPQPQPHLHQPPELYTYIHAIDPTTPPKKQVPAVTDHWATDPFEPTRKDGKIYARGTQDMKVLEIVVG